MNCSPARHFLFLRIPDGTEGILHACRWVGLLRLVSQARGWQEGTDSALHKGWHGAGSLGGLSWVQSHFHFPLALRVLTESCCGSVVIAVLL